MSTPPDNSSKSSGAGIDTGTGGFPVGQNNDLYTYNVGGEETDYPHQAWNSGQVNVDKEPRDLSRRTKATLGSYLSDTTLGKTPSSPSPVRNKYAINHSAGSVPESTSLTDEKGYPVSPDRNLQNYSEKFAPNNAVESRSKADTNLKIKRGRQDGSAIDGNDLLSSVSPASPGASSVGGKFTPEMSTVKVPESSTIGQYYGRPNLSNSVIYNRFNPEGSDYQTQGASLRSEQFAKKYNLGTSQADRDMSFARLAHVGGILSSRASVELGSMDPGYNPSQELLSAAAPGLAQLGLTNIDRGEFEAKNVIEELTQEAIPDGSLISVGTQSWGTLNNVNDQFTNISNFGMQLLAVALLVALSVVILAMSALFSIGSSGTILKTSDTYGRKPFGSSAFETSPSGLTVGSVLFTLWRSLGIQPTKNPLNKSIPTGALSFFGMNVTEVTSAGAALEAATNGLQAVSQSPGYYAILGRMVGRSFLQIGESFAAIGTAFDSGIFSGVSQIGNVVGVIRNSKFVRFVNIFARLGDQILDDKEDPFSRLGSDPASSGFGKRFTSDIDLLSPKNALKGRMMQVGEGIKPLTLSWASYRAPDLFIVPSGLSKVAWSSSARQMGMSPVYPSVPEKTAGGYKNESPTYTPANANDNRIPTEEREALEKMLESEYVPFYMHDVRTNEIISFHAFLMSLGDSYTANYDSTEGFGRVEAIKIYKSTNRKIDFSFMLAATNEMDFDSMWMKVNKLTTMLYPQFSEGRTVKDNAGNTVYMPFSQTIQAAPLVRIRIGDLFKSNYSKFNLARIFGYTYAGTEFGGKSLPSGAESSSPPKDAIEKKLKQLKRQSGNFFKTSKQLSIPAPLDATSAINPSTSQSSRSTPVGFSVPQDLVLEVVGYDEKEMKVKCKVSLPTGEDRVGVLDSEIEDLKKNYGSDEKPSKNVIGKTYLFDEADLMPAPSTQEKLKDETSGEYSTAVSNFMRDDDPSLGNAVARSFRSSGGKGIAGFIDSLSFDWYDKVTWVTDEGPGRKAPKMCRVNVSFTPIHDITPGLDHMGSNRAPIYPVKSSR